MPITAIDNQIVTLFEEAGLTPEVIAEQLSLDPLAVKASLIQFSLVYKDNVKIAKQAGNNDPIYDSDEVKIARDAILRVILTSDNEHAILRASESVIKEAKGRNDVSKVLKGSQVNVVIFNEQLKRAREAKAKSLESKPVEIVVEQILDIKGSE